MHPFSSVLVQACVGSVLLYWQERGIWKLERPCRNSSSIQRGQLLVMLKMQQKPSAAQAHSSHLRLPHYFCCRHNARACCPSTEGYPAPGTCPPVLQAKPNREQASPTLTSSSPSFPSSTFHSPWRSAGMQPCPARNNAPDTTQPHSVSQSASQPADSNIIRAFPLILII